MVVVVRAGGGDRAVDKGGVDECGGGDCGGVGAGGNGEGGEGAGGEGSGNGGGSSPCRTASRLSSGVVPSAIETARASHQPAARVAGGWRRDTVGMAMGIVLSRTAHAQRKYAQRKCTAHMHNVQHACSARMLCAHAARSARCCVITTYSLPSN